MTPRRAPSRSIPCAPQPSTNWKPTTPTSSRAGGIEYAIQPDALSDPQKLRAMSAFFWWTAWAASTNRPASDVTYTQNWPHEPLIGNQPTGGAIVWSVVSFVLLLAGVGGMVWYFASQPRTVAENFSRRAIRCWASGPLPRNAPP